MSFILVITPRTAWEAAQSAGKYESDSLAAEGFIHCSTADTVLGVAERHFRWQFGLVLLVIDESRVRAEVRYESKDGQVFYPHIYGPLNLDAVVAVHDFPPDGEGRFRLPAAVAGLLASPAQPAARNRAALLRWIGVGVLAGLLFFGGGSYLLVSRVILPAVRSVQSDGKAVGNAVLGKMQQGDYEAIYREAAPQFRQAVDHDQFLKFMQGIRASLGSPLSWKATGVNKNSSMTSSGRQ